MKNVILHSLSRLLIATLVVVALCIGFVWGCMDLLFVKDSHPSDIDIFIAIALTAFITSFMIWLWPHNFGVVMSNGGRQITLMPVSVCADELKHTNGYVAILKEQLLSSQKDSEEGVLGVIAILNKMFQISVSLVASKQKENELEAAFNEKMQIDAQLGSILQMFVNKQDEDVKENLVRLRRIQDIQNVNVLIDSILASVRKIDKLGSRIEANAAVDPAANFGFSAIAKEIAQLTKRAEDGVSEITGRISIATKGIDEDLKSAVKNNQRNNVSGNMRRVVEDVDAMKTRFSKSIEQTVRLLNGVRQGHESQLNLITTALGLFQFQDINRQRVEQVLSSMVDLNDHFQEMSEYLTQKTWKPDSLLSISAKLENQKATYVMSKQFTTHSKAAEFGTMNVVAQDNGRSNIELF